ncbi:hypothetical protein A3I18_01385 [Candidatus Campbellbacteria bacterium RIFCSPLOWO2_02_FULL_35_11]|uniref:CDP-diacylglycerol--glycerol-3-phosphate 3-phosphatidyltransferase n=2 Tax=Candidatus Campbelliibacteriota TaxID=1752727 RepID=A0A1F5ELP8_9BACT|nr:MAG: hypothetical protein A3E89_01120 [Candidatus Campbellbacteria bacterium RIFCSPHIGHO2_12_FULL_35_10]OGD70311.1 MAG: hypothetical protein A3I18_01385 [Candidatus Campbellbacteria bacterium RIFCSPLOWO2_02_FULL_35_11]
MNIYKIIANCLSASRLLIPFVLFWPTGSIIEKMVITLFLVSTDFVDGWIARKGGSASKLGELIDHTSDKVAFVSIGLFIWTNNLVPFPIVFTALVSEILIFLLSILIMKLNSRLIITKIGRTKMLFFCVGFLFIFLNQIFPKDIFETLTFVSFVTGILLSLILNLFYSKKIIQLAIYGDKKAV